MNYTYAASACLTKGGVLASLINREHQEKLACKSGTCVMNCFENITACFSSPCHFCVTMLSVVRLQCVCALTFFIQTTSPLKPLIGLLANFTRMIPAWPHTKVAQTVPGDSISRLQGKTNRFSKFNFQLSSCPKLQRPKLLY